MKLDGSYLPSYFCQIWILSQLTFKMCNHAFVIKYGSIKNIQKGVIGTLASYTDTFYSTETSLKISLKRRDAAVPSARPWNCWHTRLFFAKSLESPLRKWYCVMVNFLSVNLWRQNRQVKKHHEANIRKHIYFVPLKGLF